MATGYLEEKIATLSSVIFDDLDDRFKILLKNMVDGVTSEVGRALVGLIFLQLTIKSISPEQNIRLHKGSNSRRKFSWVKGISMRSIDSSFNTPFLRKFGLLKLNKDGLFMTRSLAENYPYTSLYKAEMRGPFDDWISLVDAMEAKLFSAELALSYLLSLLKNRSDDFKEKAEALCKKSYGYEWHDFTKIQNLIIKFFNSTDYSARAFEVTMHCFFQALQEIKLLDDLELVALSQMRSANKKHGNVGDIELMELSVIVEAWDAKYGKPYLRDELEELRDKLLEFGIELYDKTVLFDKYMRRRGDEIKKWIDEHDDVDGYVIIDDLGGKWLRPCSSHLLETSELKGLQEKHVKVAERILNMEVKR